MATNEAQRQFTPSDLELRFQFHPATTERRKSDHQYIRTVLAAVADDINAILPDGREKALVVTKLEEAMFWANAGLARQEDK